MTIDHYQVHAARFNNPNNKRALFEKVDELRSDIDLGDAICAAFGISGEAGELVDLLKKWVFHHRELDLEHLKKEIGDVMWYIALLCNTFHFNMEDILQLNIDKLSARYPDGFNYHDANHRSKGDV